MVFLALLQSMNRVPHKSWQVKTHIIRRLEFKLTLRLLARICQPIPTNVFNFSLDGVNASTAITFSVNGSASTGALVSGTTLAASVQAAVRAADISIRNPNTGSAITAADLSDITVKYDADTAELVFRDSAGRAMGFGYAASSTLTTTNGPFLEEVTGAANKGLTVQRDFVGAAQGDVINATEITLAFSTSDASFNFGLNGKYLDGASTNSSAAMANAVSVDFGTNTSTLQKLNTLMTTLNGAIQRQCLSMQLMHHQIV